MVAKNKKDRDKPCLDRSNAIATKSDSLAAAGEEWNDDSHQTGTRQFSNQET